MEAMKDKWEEFDERESERFTTKDAASYYSREAYKAALRKAIDNCIQGAKLGGTNDKSAERIKGYQFFLKLIESVTPIE